MLNIGRKQKLVVVKKVEFGIYLGETREAGEKERVLLPIKQVPEGTKEGDELEVFLYRDSSDRLIATTREPKLVLGERGCLKRSCYRKDRSISGLGSGKRSVASI